MGHLSRSFGKQGPARIPSELYLGNKRAVSTITRSHRGSPRALARRCLLSSADLTSIEPPRRNLDKERVLTRRKTARKVQNALNRRCAFRANREVADLRFHNCLLALDPGALCAPGTRW